MKTLAFVLLLLMSLTSSANETWQRSKELGSEIGQNLKDYFAHKPSKAAREKSDLALNGSYSFLSYPFPSTTGVSAHYIASADWSFGTEFTSANWSLEILKLQLLDFDEKSLSLEAKRFFGNSFNIRMALAYRQTDFSFAPSLFSISLKESETISAAEALVIRFGVGNQWHFKQRYTLAVDWLSVEAPFYRRIIRSAARFASSSEDRNYIEKAEKTLQLYPVISMLKIQAGFIF